MNTSIYKKEKKVYYTPSAECIKIDTEISLALESAPPTGPDEGSITELNNLINNPFKNNIG